MTVSAWLTVLTAVTVAATGITPAGVPAPGRSAVAAQAIWLDAGPAGGTTSTDRFVPPLALEVVTAFQPPATRYGAGHRGVDLAATAGQVVTAAAAGMVVYAGRLADRGVISIEHRGGLRTTYEPVTASVSAGDIVAAGDEIGVVEEGHAACAPAVCLHLGARMPDRVYLDPLSLFGPWRVRLKPWRTDQ